LCDGTAGSTIDQVSSVAKLVQAMQSNPQNVAYNDLFKVCEHYFGKPRQRGTSHAVFKMPWAGDRV
jgi:regulator of replication initiation timing